MSSMRGLDFWLRALPTAPANDGSGWRILAPFRGALGGFPILTAHVSLLGRGEIPHPPHQHAEQELLVVLSGEITILTTDKPEGAVTESRGLGRGSFVYHSAWRWHTLQNTGAGLASYFVFKWRTAVSSTPDSSPSSFIFESCTLDKHQPAASGALKLYPIANLRPDGRVRAHWSILESNRGYAPHRDSYDVLMVLLSGSVETFHNNIAAPAVIFCAANVPHGLRNSGARPAEYLVFEFENERSRP